MPHYRVDVLIYGAEGDYKSYGQEVRGEMSGSDIPAGGLRQIDPRMIRGYSIERGFSGSPVLDEMGNIVWGMIAKVDLHGHGVAYAIPADKLRIALRAAHAEAKVRQPDAADKQTEEALASLRSEFEPQSQTASIDTDQTQQEVERLRQRLRRLGQDVREAHSDESRVVLDALTKGDSARAIDILRSDFERKLTIYEKARRELAESAEQLSWVLRPFGPTTTQDAGQGRDLGNAKILKGALQFGSGPFVIRASIDEAKLKVHVDSFLTVPCEFELRFIIANGLAQFRDAGIQNFIWTGRVNGATKAKTRSTEAVVDISRTGDKSGVEIITCDSLRYRYLGAPNWSTWKVPGGDNAIMIEIFD
jgi:hypothetical protein